MLAPFSLVNIYRMLNLLLCELFVVLVMLSHSYEPVYSACGLFTGVPHAIMRECGKSMFNWEVPFFENCSIGEVLYNGIFPP
jgi:hypothetical protein